MTSRKTWPIVITLFLMLGLFLVACERPLPDDGSNDAPSSAPPADAYPEPDTEVDQTAPDTETTDSAYPAPDSELALPAEEGDEAAEGYPAGDGEAAEGEHSEGETAESEAAEGEHSEGEAAEEQSTEDTTAETEVAEGESTDDVSIESEAAEEQSGEQIHTVAAGDTLYKIGAQYGMSWVEIAQANDITNPDSLYIGQELIIPDLSAPDATESTAEATEGDAGEAAESTEPTETIHVVQSGENLYRISIKYGVNMMDVARENDLANFDDLAVGQELIIPGVEATETEAEGDEVPVEEAEAETEEVTHEVLEGETVFGIAFQYGISWTKLVEQNDINSPYTLEAGQILVVPSGD